MNRTRGSLFLVAAALLALSPFVFAADDKVEKADTVTWTEDYAAAVAESAKTGKPIMIDFTGSDWCGYCVKQHAEVFSKAEWQKWAAENVILVTADFPTPKKAQADAVKLQNKELQKKYGPRGFPTILFVDAKGTELGRWAGYGPGSGPEAWIKRAEPIVAKAKEAAK